MVMKYKIGDRVRIVSKKIGDKWNEDGRMDKWLGKIMTISDCNCNSGYYIMKEDNIEWFGGWVWYDNMIEGLANKYTKENTTTLISPDKKVSICYDKDNPHKKLVTAIRHEDDEFDEDFVEKLLLARMNDDKETEKKLRSEQFDADVDWMKVAIDTPVLVSDDKLNWGKRHFCVYNPNGEDKYLTFSNNCSSFSGNSVFPWKYCKLAK